MPDAQPRDTTFDWTRALSALPLEPPPGDGWSRLAPRLSPHRAPVRHLPHWLAVAAAVALVALLPWRSPVAPPPDARDTRPAATASEADPLSRLYEESRELESLLRYARDERMSSATAALLAGELDQRIAGIDASLRQSDLPRDEQLALWRDRVDILRSAVGFEGTRRWMAANGGQYDAALVQVD